MYAAFGFYGLIYIQSVIYQLIMFLIKSRMGKYIFLVFSVCPALLYYFIILLQNLCRGKSLSCCITGGDIAGEREETGKGIVNKQVF